MEETNMQKTEKRTVYFTMVVHPERGMVRVGKAYASSDAANSWLGFVSHAWRGLKVVVEPFTLTLVDGKPDAESTRVLSERYNMTV